MTKEVTGLMFIGFVLGMIWSFVLFDNRELDQFKCTKQVISKHTYPQEYECTQWTKENEL